MQAFIPVALFYLVPYLFWYIPQEASIKVSVSEVRNHLPTFLPDMRVSACRSRACHIATQLPLLNQNPYR